MKDPSVSDLDARTRQAVDDVLGRIPSGLFLMTAAHEGRTRGVIARWVQQVSEDPPMVLVALEKGHDIVPLIQASHSFAVNQIAADDRLILRKFSGEMADDDPFQSMETVRRATGSPVLGRAQAFLDCDLVRHVDIDGDHDLYVGLIRDGAPLKGGDVHVDLTVTPRDNGER